MLLFNTLQLFFMAFLEVQLHGFMIYFKLFNLKTEHKSQLIFPTGLNKIDN